MTLVLAEVFPEVLRGAWAASLLTWAVSCRVIRDDHEPRRNSLKAIHRILKRRVECFALHWRVSLSLHQHTHRWEQACYL